MDEWKVVWRPLRRKPRRQCSILTRYWFILLTMSMTMVFPSVLMSMFMAMFSVSMLMFTLATLQNMKESFAEERNDCQERMERR